MEFLENEFHLSLVRERLLDLITLPEHWKKYKTVSLKVSKYLYSSGCKSNFFFDNKFMIIG